MYTLDIPEINYHAGFASEVNEMTNSQFLEYIRLMLEYVSGKIGIEEMKANLIRSLLDIRMSFRYSFLRKSRKEDCNTNIARLSELTECFIEEFETKDGEKQKRFKTSSTRNFIPKIGRYHGPENAFRNLTFCEYRHAREAFRQFAEDQNEQSLNRLVAILYRPAKPFSFIRKYFPGWSGEIRTRFTSKSNPRFLSRRILKIANVPYHIRYAVFLYFCGCEDFMKTGKPVVDGNELDFSQLYKGEDGDSGSNVGLVGLLYGLAESGVFGDIEKVDDHNYWDVMVRIYQLVMQNREMESKMRQNGTGN